MAMFHRKTKEEGCVMRGRIHVTAGPQYRTGANGDANPAADNHKIEGTVYPYVDLVTPAGRLVLSPGEVKVLLESIQDIQIKSAFPQNYLMACEVSKQL